MLPVLPFLPLLNLLGVGELINNIFGEQAVVRARVTEDQKIQLIMAMKQCNEESARRYYKDYLDYHMNDDSLQTAVDISHRTNEEAPYRPENIQATQVAPEAESPPQANVGALNAIPKP